MGTPINVTVWSELSDADKNTILNRPGYSVDLQQEVFKKTQDIINHVRFNQDKALYEYASEFDSVKLDELTVTEEEIEQAEQQVSAELKQAMQLAKKNIEKFHLAQQIKDINIETSPGITCRRQTRPIQTVGLYAPGGSAPLPSSVLMTGIPAKIAGCPNRILCSPPRLDGTIDQRVLVAANMCGIDKIYKVGGAHAIAAMAYGTESVPKVDKIFGPGNQWVTTAKLLVAEDPEGAALDLPAGPSEICVIADDKANPSFVAADLLSQAEHSVDAQAMLLTPSLALAGQVNDAITAQLKKLKRLTIIDKALVRSHIIIVDNIVQAIEISNRYAPEHLSLQVNNAEQYIDQIQYAGTVFVGPWAAEALGDYVTGSNHVLPTYGFANNYSGLGLSDFMNKITFQIVTEKGIKHIGAAAELIAEAEGLDAHQQAVSIRLRELE